MSNRTSQIVLTLRDVSKVYRGRAGDLTALRNVSFDVEAGSVVAMVVGPSGSGKTTLLNVVSGLDRPTTGEVRILGQRLSDLDPDDATDFRRRNIGFIFQFFNLIPTMTAADNVAIPLLVERLPRRTIRERVMAALDAVGLAERAASRASELSGGEMQRVAVARALIMEPALILADEPTGNVDTVTGDMILQLLCSGAHASGRAILLVTHSYLATAYAHRILVMRDGEIVDELTPAERTSELHLIAGGRGDKPHR